MRAAERQAAMRPVQERTRTYTREAQVEAYLASRQYTIFPGLICDLTNEDEFAQARAWVLALLEELGLST